MANHDRDWMWSEALQMLARADQIRRQTFHLSGGAQPRWEPPVDVLETPTEVLIVAALPGVDPDVVEAVIDGAELVVSGRREPSPVMRRAVVHRLELPLGQFQRRVPLPPGRYDRVDWNAEHGCLTVILRKAERA